MVLPSEKQREGMQGSLVRQTEPQRGRREGGGPGGAGTRLSPHSIPQSQQPESTREGSKSALKDSRNNISVLWHLGVPIQLLYREAYQSVCLPLKQERAIQNQIYEKCDNVEKGDKNKHIKMMPEETDNFEYGKYFLKPEPMPSGRLERYFIYAMRTRCPEKRKA